MQQARAAPLAEGYRHRFRGRRTVCPQCPARCRRYLISWLSLRDPKSPVRGCPAKGRCRTPVRSHAPFLAGLKPFCCRSSCDEAP